MINLTLNNAEGFVRKHARRGVSVKWDGWAMVFFKADRRAYKSPDGRFDRATGEWGFETRVVPNSKGNWMVSPSLTRGNKSARN